MLLPLDGYIKADSKADWQVRHGAAASGVASREGSCRAPLLASTASLAQPPIVCICSHMIASEKRGAGLHPLLRAAQDVHKFFRQSGCVYDNTVIGLPTSGAVAMMWVVGATHARARSSTAPPGWGCHAHWWRVHVPPSACSGTRTRTCWPRWACSRPARGSSSSRWPRRSRAATSTEVSGRKGARPRGWPARPHAPRGRLAAGARAGTQHLRQALVGAGAPRRNTRADGKVDAPLCFDNPAAPMGADVNIACEPQPLAAMILSSITQYRVRWASCFNAGGVGITARPAHGVLCAARCSASARDSRVVGASARAPPRRRALRQAGCWTRTRLRR